MPGTAGIWDMGESEVLSSLVSYQSATLTEDSNSRLRVACLEVCRVEQLRILQTYRSHGGGLEALNKACEPRQPRSLLVGVVNRTARVRLLMNTEVKCEARRSFHVELRKRQSSAS